MKKLTLADAHCDTLTKFSENPYNSDDAMWTKSSFEEAGGDFQIFAIFTPPHKHGSEATSYAARHCGVFSKTCHDVDVRQVLRSEDIDKDGLKIMLSLEGATPIQDDMNLLYSFYSQGVRAMGLTWNHRNMLADGIDNDYGLTHFGGEVIREMESLGMMIDVSHLNVAGFKDVFKTVNCPVVATHSNVRSLCEHKRNLEDWQIKEIIDRKGFIGLNFLTAFVNGVNISESKDPNQAQAESVRSLLKHTEYILKMGGEDALGFGADYDGITDGTYVHPSGYPKFLEICRVELGLDEHQLEKISHLNLKGAVARCIK